MPIPEIPTTQEIKDNIISNIEQEINQNTPLLLKAFNRVLATALAGMITLIYKFGYWIAKQIFTTTQDKESLIKEGTELGIILKTSVSTQITITITGVAEATLDTGTRFVDEKTGLVYETIDSATIPIGETTVEVDAICLTSGATGNVIVGTEINIISPVVSFQEIAIVYAIVVSGVDEEETEDYRSRLLQAKRRKPQGGAIADYVKWTLEVVDVTRAFVFRTAPGVITSYALTDNAGSRIPDATKTLEIQDYLRDEARKPLNDTVYAGTFVETTFDVTITAMNPDTEDIRSAITTNMTDFLLAREPKQYQDQVSPKNIISQAKLVNVAINSGAVVFVLTFKVKGTGTNLTSYTLANNEIAKLGTLSMTGV